MSMDPGTTQPVDVPVVKAGIVTTEWWTTLLTVVSGAVIAVLSLYGKDLDGSKLQPLIGALAILASGISSAYYNHSRGVVKAAALSAASYRPTLLSSSIGSASAILDLPEVVEPAVVEPAVGS